MMKKQIFGNMIATLRKEKGMTQVELAEKIAVIDKAVSKWEQDLSFPNISSIEKVKEKNNKVSEIVDLTLKGVGLAMSMLGIGVTYFGIVQFSKNDG